MFGQCSASRLTAPSSAPPGRLLPPLRGGEGSKGGRAQSSRREPGAAKRSFGGRGASRKACRILNPIAGKCVLIADGRRVEGAACAIDVEEGDHPQAYGFLSAPYEVLRAV